MSGDETLSLDERSPDPETRLTLSWYNLSVSFKEKIPKRFFWEKQTYEEKQILNNVSGFTRSGTLMAIMGASGAGKTTFLATISQRIKYATRGEIMVNGKVISNQFMNKISGFVPQYDLVFATLTLWEHIRFMAKLKMDRRVQDAVIRRRLNSLLSELGLTKCRNTRLAALSGGEMKRLSLAVQLITNPPLLFCDEPTTGLDSYSAGVVVENLRQFAERGKCVVCTIHQPASGIFDLFHNVLLLAGGRVAFMGPVSDASSYFNSVGVVCPPSYNPAEFYVQQLAVIPGREEESTTKIQWLCDQFASSMSGVKMNADVKNQVLSQRNIFQNDKGNWSSHSSTSSTDTLEPEEGVTMSKDRVFAKYLSVKKVNCFVQLYLLAWRSLIDGSRNYANHALRFLLYLFIAVMISSPYVQITEDLDQKTIQNMQGFMYMIITETVFTYSYSVLHTFPAEIPMLLREIGGGLYSTGPYYLSKMILLLPKAVLEALCYSFVVFFIAGLKGNVFLFAIPVVFCAVTATAYGCVMSASFKSISTAALVSVPIELISLMFSGMYLQLLDLPSQLSWIKYLSQFYYGQEAVSILQWEEIQTIACYNDTNLPCIPNGAGVLNKYGYEASNFSFDLIGLAAIYCLAHAFGFIAIVKRSRQQPVY